MLQMQWVTNIQQNLFQVPSHEYTELLILKLEGGSSGASTYPFSPLLPFHLSFSSAPISLTRSGESIIEVKGRGSAPHSHSLATGLFIL